MLTGRGPDAEEALSLALLHRVVPDEDPDAAVAARAKPVTRRPAAVTGGRA